MKVYRDFFGKIRPAPETLYVNGREPISTELLFKHCSNGMIAVSLHDWETAVKPMIMVHNLIDEIELITHEEALRLKLIDGESDEQISKR